MDHMYPRFDVSLCSHLPMPRPLCPGAQTAAALLSQDLWGSREFLVGYKLFPFLHFGLRSPGLLKPWSVYVGSGCICCFGCPLDTWSVPEKSRLMCLRVRGSLHLRTPFPCSQNPQVPRFSFPASPAQFYLLLWSLLSLVV